MRWPAGSTETIRDVAANQIVTITEGQGITGRIAVFRSVRGPVRENTTLQGGGKAMKSAGYVVPIAVVVGVSMLMAARVPAQTSSGAGASAKWVTPRTAWGDPDLQGIWPSSEMIGVPLQRDPALGTRAVLTDRNSRSDRSRPHSRQKRTARSSLHHAGGGDGTGPPGHWGERGRPQRQASLIVDPPNGRMPPMTPDGERRAADRARRSSTRRRPLQRSG